MINNREDYFLDRFIFSFKPRRTCDITNDDVSFYFKGLDGFTFGVDGLQKLMKSFESKEVGFSTNLSNCDYCKDDCQCVEFNSADNLFCSICKRCTECILNLCKNKRKKQIYSCNYFNIVSDYKKEYYDVVSEKFFKEGDVVIIGNDSFMTKLSNILTLKKIIKNPDENNIHTESSWRYECDICDAPHYSTRYKDKSIKICKNCKKDLIYQIENFEEKHRNILISRSI